MFTANIPGLGCFKERPKSTPPIFDMFGECRWFDPRNSQRHPRTWTCWRRPQLVMRMCLGGCGSSLPQINMERGKGGRPFSFSRGPCQVPCEKRGRVLVCSNNLCHSQRISMDESGNKVWWVPFTFFWGGNGMTGLISGDFADELHKTIIRRISFFWEQYLPAKPAKPGRGLSSIHIYIYILLCYIYIYTYVFVYAYIYIRIYIYIHII